MPQNPEAPHIVIAAEEIPAPGYLPPTYELSRHVAGIGFLGGRAVFNMDEIRNLRQTEAVVLAKSLVGFTESEMAEQQYTTESEVHRTIKSLNSHFDVDLYSPGALYELARPERGVLKVSKLGVLPGVELMQSVEQVVLAHVSMGMTDLEIARKLHLERYHEEAIESRLVRKIGSERRHVLALGGVMLGLNGLKPNEYAHLDETIADHTTPNHDEGSIRYYAEYLED